jgi:hypothetical protein
VVVEHGRKKGQGSPHAGCFAFLLQLNIRFTLKVIRLLGPCLVPAGRSLFLFGSAWPKSLNAQASPTRKRIANVEGIYKGLEAENKANRYGFRGMRADLVPEYYLLYRELFLPSHIAPE